ncbi:MAG: hypothetical protein GOU99_01680 [Candidatus Altiarchaeota archaeon]|nr:hypothetical protein [Candidatus Altiarchaeota archaeon]
MKGATPIIAVILLLLITIAAGGSTYLWISKTQSTLFERTTSGVEESTKDVYGEISIGTVWNKTTLICMTIRNTSDNEEITYTTNDLEKMAVYVDEVPYDFNTSYIATDLFQGYFLSVCVCNTTDSSVGCNTPYLYSSATSITLEVDPPYGSGDTYVYQYTSS